MSEDADRLKQRGNELFIAKDFSAADECYTQALALATDTETRKVLFTNRSAARLGLDRFEDAVQDANEAIKLDPSFMKAYYRKCSALESLNQPGEAYYTWLEASQHCEVNETLTKQLRKTKQTWSKVFRSPSFAVQSASDLAQRILLFSDKRERLSTLAHLWNDSSLEERFSYFEILLSIIGGEGVLSETNQEILTPEVMADMPMGNYADLPRDRLAHWCDFFMTLAKEDKGAVFRTVWMSLSSEEQHDIIKDLRYLFAQAAQGPIADLVGEEVVEEVRVVDEEAAAEKKPSKAKARARLTETAYVPSSSSSSSSSASAAPSSRSSSST